MSVETGMAFYLRVDHDERRPRQNRRNARARYAGYRTNNDQSAPLPPFATDQPTGSARKVRTPSIASGLK